LDTKIIIKGGFRILNLKTKDCFLKTFKQSLGSENTWKEE
jgi:hypothetical protein